MKNNILITGVPKSGKSTLLKSIVEGRLSKVGFLTNEVLVNTQRVGFEIVTFEGKKAMLANKDVKTKNKVSRYFVSVDNLESLIPSVSKFNQRDLLYLDEIGQMQLLSKEFEKMCISFLNSDNICLATVSKVFDCNFINMLKLRDDCIWIEITNDNRNAKTSLVEALIEKIIKAKKYISEKDRFVFQDNKVIIQSEHGVRKVLIGNSPLVCDCNFYKKISICSHIIATEELLKTNLN